MKGFRSTVLLACTSAVLLLTGCAASVKSSGTETLVIQEPAKKNLVVTLEGNTKVQQNDDWLRLKQEWNEALRAEASRAGFNLAAEKAALTDDNDAVCVKINVTNFRYLTPGARYGAGVMVGNAWINSSAEYSYLKSQKLIGTRTYDTSSSAWEGVMSAMTKKQAEAISQKIISDIKTAKSN
ncbi:DUF4410 domain-containing protein [Pseudomonas sichuanensis]|uniref:DUF4410 domain-containing protein n=1 Tax=Pseudomonas TaxID=286 RepID=UPI00129BB62E|nr:MULTISPECIES: DUF4410 domain-containing protein [Pseudomonas]MDH0731004.1 DUF4410 domain-containing protein [Pseudomonas sichuanensis]MDH1581019.1 DUF4410 domain-containing protein [Pseudomonas sichuanensis]MDH1591120.1 DUF4410 domain-containing protein [Pseudomonas sichuanensis]MDH1596789.1 DUF4410 domain-containing protein [Pseudomonas sichuanensis]MDU9403906.1 DUF4410 domain-containing protein [Pseudomonas sp. zfem004]